MISINIGKNPRLPLGKNPDQTIHNIPPIKHFGIQTEDYLNISPKMLVNEGDPVLQGQTIFTSTEYPEIAFTSPQSGTLEKIEYSQDMKPTCLTFLRDKIEKKKIFTLYEEEEVKTLSINKIMDQLLSSGLWAAFRTRPYSHVPNPGKRPNSIFINATDSDPYPLFPQKVISNFERDFLFGVKLLSKLANEKVFLIKNPQYQGPLLSIAKIEIVNFSGNYHSSLAGTHIHMLDRVSSNKEVWHVNYQEVIAIGQLFLKGEANFTRVVAIVGPNALRPRAINTFYGANLLEISHNEKNSTETKIISGKILNGIEANAENPFLRRHHYQINLLTTCNKKTSCIFLPNLNNFGIDNFFTNLINKKKKYSFTDSSYGPIRQFYPAHNFKKYFPLKLEILLLLEALVCQNVTKAIEMGALEIDEEDLALCTFFCPSKINYGPLLRQILNKHYFK